MINSCITIDACHRLSLCSKYYNLLIRNIFNNNVFYRLPIFLYLFAYKNLYLERIRKH